MSKAFTSEETPEAPLLVPRRAPLPEGSPNYVTARGLLALREELARLESERLQLDVVEDDEHVRVSDEDRTRGISTLQARIQELDERISTAELVDTTTHAPDEVRFGAHVRVRNDDDEEREFEIVGVDEADAAHGLVAFAAPLARAVLGKHVGDAVTLRTPRGEEELEIVAVTYAPS